MERYQHKSIKLVLESSHTQNMDMDGGWRERETKESRKLVFNMEFNLKDKHNQTFCSCHSILLYGMVCICGWLSRTRMYRISGRRDVHPEPHSESDGIELLREYSDKSSSVPLMYSICSIYIRNGGVVGGGWIAYLKRKALPWRRSIGKNVKGKHTE